MSTIDWSLNSRVSSLDREIAQQNAEESYLESTLSSLAKTQVRAATNYLASNYDPQVGLIRESPNSDMFLLYGDNYLAVEALRQALIGYDNSTLAAIADNISETLLHYSSSVGGALNQFMILGGNWSAPCDLIHTSASYSISNSTQAKVAVTLNNGTGSLSPSESAGTALLEAVCSLRQGNSAGWNSGLIQATSLFDGTGFCDGVGHFKPCTYQTYELALYLYAERSQCEPTNQTTDLAVMRALLLEQAPGGGYYVGYTSVGSEAPTNTETTSLAILALSESTICSAGP